MGLVPCSVIIPSCHFQVKAKLPFERVGRSSPFQSLLQKTFSDTNSDNISQLEK